MRGMATAIQWTADRGNHTSQDPKGPAVRNATRRRILASAPSHFCVGPSQEWRHDAPVMRRTSVLGAARRVTGRSATGVSVCHRLAAPVFVLRVVARADRLMATPSAVLDDVRRGLLTRALR
jgi:hypothetical protein